MALFINGVGQDTFSMNGVAIDNLYVDGVLVWSSSVNTKPVISIIGDNPMYLILDGSAYVEQGATATDAEDGDISNDIVIGGDTPDVSVEGYYYVTYNVTDSEGLSADEQVRTVSVYVVTVPKYELTETLINDGTFDYVPDSNNPESAFQGKLTESDGTTPYLPNSAQYPGNGLLELNNGRIMNTQFNQVTSRDTAYGIYDADGSTVYKIWAIENVLGPQYIVYEGDQDTPIASTGSHVLDGIPDGDFIVADGRPSWLPSLDTTIPVITMLGTSPIDVDKDSVYTDAGATALDDTDGDITADIVTVNNVDTAIEGASSVTYDVDDSSGNSADTVTRVVNVVAASFPELIYGAGNENGVVDPSFWTVINTIGSSTIFEQIQDGLNSLKWTPHNQYSGGWQSFPAEIGETYTVSGKLSGENTDGSTLNIDDTTPGATASDHTSTTVNSTTWVDVTFDFVATATTHYISFKAVDPWTALFAVDISVKRKA